MYHVKLNKAMLSGALTAVLPGDPGRVEKTARAIDPDAVFSCFKPGVYLLACRSVRA